MQKLVLVILLYLISPSISAQTTVKAQDSLANRLVEKHKKQNAAHPLMPGYRIQLYFGNDRTQATELKTEFATAYPKTGAYVVYRQPNFKLRVGDFKTRLEALKFLNDIQSDYNTAFIVQDDVRLPEE